MTTPISKRADADPEGAAHEVLEVFRACGGKATLAAAKLGMSRRQFDRLCTRLGDVVVSQQNSAEKIRDFAARGWGVLGPVSTARLHERLTQDRCNTRNRPGGIVRTAPANKRPVARRVTAAEVPDDLLAPID